MKHLIQISIVILLIILTGCHKDSLFQGRDNDIAFFQLKKNDLVLSASIIQDSIVIQAPGNFSLTGASATILLSEHARISPDPASITDWEKTQQFLVTSYNGSTHTYTYVLQRNAISKDGDIILTTQSDVDALAKPGVNRINGDLIIGKTTGPDSIYSLAGLKGLRTITGDLILNPTFAGTDLKGLDSLETVGAFLIGKDLSFYEPGPVMNLKTLSLPHLKQVMTNMIINGAGITSLDCPALTKIGLGLQVIYVDSLTTVVFPKLESVLQSITMQGNFMPNVLQSVSFPALTSVGGDIYMVQWSNLETVNFPALTSTGSFNILGETTLTTLAAPRLATIATNIDLSYNTSLTNLDLTALTRIGGSLRMENVSSLANFDGLHNLTNIAGDLTIASSPLIKNLTPLNKLKTVGGNLLLQSMDQLSNLDGLSSLTNAHAIYIFYNPVLADYTGLQHAIPALTADQWQVSGNAYDPSYQDMVDGKYIAN